MECYIEEINVKQELDIKEEVKEELKMPLKYTITELNIHEEVDIKEEFYIREEFDVNEEFDANKEFDVNEEFDVKEELVTVTAVASGPPSNAPSKCSVCVLLNKPFSKHSFMDKSAFVEKGRPKPTLSELTTKIKTCKRYFHVDLYEQHEWLTGCETISKLFCWPCLLFSKDDGVWNKTGFCDLNNLHKVVKRHTISQAHLQAVIKEKTFGKSLIEHSIDKQLKISNRRHNKVVEKNRTSLKKLIDVICHLASNDFGFRCHYESAASTNGGNFKNLLSLLSNYDVSLKNHLEEFRGTSSHIQNDLISATSAVVLQKIKLDLKKTRFVAIVLSETADVSNVSQVSVVGRYVIDGTVQERFLKFLDASNNRTADVLHQIVCDIIADFEVEGDRLIAQSYDGGVALVGNLGGLQEKVRDTFPNALFVHCFAHPLNLIMSQSVAHIKECKIFFSTLSGVATFFSKSLKRSQALDLIAQKRLKKKVPTRWTYNGQLLHTVHEYRSLLIDFFESILENSCDWDGETINSSKGYLEYFKRDFNFNFLLNIFAEIFPFCDQLFDILPSKLNDIGFCVEKIEEFQNVINSKGNDFEAIWTKTEQNEDIEEPQRKRLRTNCEVRTSYRTLQCEIIDEISGQIENRFKSFKDLKFLELCSFSEFKNKPFPETAFLSLISHYGNHFDVPALRSELTAMYATEDVKSKNNAGELLNFLNQTGLQKAYCEVLKLCELVSTIPAAGASVERGVSVFERIEKFVTNSAGECGLSEFSLLSIEKHLLKRLSEHPRFYDDIINEFAKKTTRLELQYK